VEHGLCGDGKKFLLELFSKGATERSLFLLKNWFFSSSAPKSQQKGRVNRWLTKRNPRLVVIFQVFWYHKARTKGSEVMTLGNRIAEKRKAMKLSQEALGEQLGVSRQAIYKWESDSALPEIEKLMALSRLFGVTIGWLLGMEAEENPTNRPELTPAQLQMAEEIAQRYLAAASSAPAEPVKPKKNRKFWIASTVFVVVLAILFCQQGKLNRQYQTLESNYNNLSGQISSLNAQIANLDPEPNGGETGNDLTASNDITITDKDLAAGTVTFACTAVPKSYVDGMTAVFTATADGKVTEADAQLQGSQTFTASLTCPLMDNLSVSVSFSDASGRHTQSLVTYDSLYSETVPSVETQIYSGLYGNVLDGKLSLAKQYVLCRSSDTETFSVYNDAPQSWYGSVKSIRVGLFCDQKLVKWAKKTDTPPKDYNTSGSGSAMLDAEEQWFVLPKYTLSVSPKKVYTFAAIVKDTAGRTFVYPGDFAYQLNEKEQSMDMVSDYTIDTDVSHWEYK
jgi:transcriptional regulator with XRE-family HTH domain